MPSSLVVAGQDVPRSWSRAVMTEPAAEPKRLAFFERYLTVWVATCIIGGIALGKTLPGVARALDAFARHLREAGLEQVAEVPVDHLEDATEAVRAIVGGGLAAPRAVVRARPAAVSPLW